MHKGCCWKIDEGTLGIPMKHHWWGNIRKGVGSQNTYKNLMPMWHENLKRNYVRIPYEMFLLFDDMHVILSGCCMPLIPKKGFIKEGET
jgi:hypothetical protein